MSEQSDSMVREAKENLEGVLASISLTELKRLAEDEQYAED